MDTSKLAQKLFHPHRARLEAARREATLDLLPSVLGERRFATASSPRIPLVPQGNLPDVAPSVAAVTLSADPEGVLAAEALALEVCTRLVPWGATRPSGVQWVCVKGVPPLIDNLGGAFLIARLSLETSLEEVGVELAQEMVLPPIVRQVEADARGWQLAVSRDLTVPTSVWPPAQVAKKPFRELANPFDVLLQLWSTGYLVDMKLSDADSTVRLFAPFIE